MKSFAPALAKHLAKIATITACLSISTVCLWFFLWAGVMHQWANHRVRINSPWLHAVAPMETFLRSTPMTDKWRKNYMRNRRPRIQYHAWTEAQLQK